MEIKRANIVIPSTISIILLLIAIPRGLPYDYYIFLRWVITVSSVYIAWTSYKLKDIFWIGVFGIVAILFNPIFPIHLTKETWVVIDLMVATIFFIGIFLIKKGENSERRGYKNNLVLSMIWEKIVSKFKGIDDFYSDVKPEQINLYQKFFNKMIEVVNVDVLTERISHGKFGRDGVEKYYEKLDKVLDEARKNNLKEAHLQVMFEQYIFADIWRREIDKDHWVQTVMQRKSVDYFPDTKAIIYTLFEKNQKRK